MEWSSQTQCPSTYSGIFRLITAALLKKPRRPEPPFPGLALHFCCHGSNRLGVTRDDNSTTSVEYIDPRPEVTLWY